MLTQSLPPAASNYAAAQRLEQQAAISAVLRQWRRMGEDFDASWLQVAPSILTILTEAQRRVAGGADDYLSAVLGDTGQRDDQFAEPNTAGLVGVTGAGEPLEHAVSLAPIRAKQAVADGATPYQALQSAGTWLSFASGTLLSDTGRAAENLGMYSRRGGGFVRMLTPPSCSRCVVLAGKWFRYNEGFLRHPRCDCRHIPASESIAGDLTVDPRAYFDSLDDAGQVKMLGSKANAAAVRDGADIGQLVNAYSRASGMQFAQVSAIKVDARGNKFTLSGTTRRASAHQQQLALRRNGVPQARLMPESIARRAVSDEERTRLLKLYGWIKDDAAIRRGRVLISEQRRVEGIIRARERRAAASGKAKPPATATGGSGSGSVPPRTPRAAGATPDPSDRAAWARRQEALGIDTGGDVLEPHEIEFVERFQALGHRLRWIPRDTTGTPRLPTNDFVWLDNDMLVTELKSTTAKYATIRSQIRSKVARMQRRGLQSENFVIDLGDRHLGGPLRKQLEQYNRRQVTHPIKRLWVMHSGVLEEIRLV